MSRFLNRSIEDNKNVLNNLRIETERLTVKVLVSQLDSEVNAIEGELKSMQDELKYINDFGSRRLKREIDFIHNCIDMALVAVIIAKNHPFGNN